MAKMVKDVYCCVNGKTVLVKSGEDAPKGDSEKLIKKGYAIEEVKAPVKSEEVKEESKPEPKKTTATKK